MALLGLICIGLLGLGGVIFLVQTRQAQEAIVDTDLTPDVILPSPTPTSTSTATPTETPLPTATGTRVVGNGEQGAAVAPGETATLDPNATPTGTRVVVIQTPETADITTPTATLTPPPAEIPAGGGVLATADNRFLAWAGVAVLLLLAVGVSRSFKARS